MSRGAGGYSPTDGNGAREEQVTGEGGHVCCRQLVARVWATVRWRWPCSLGSRGTWGAGVEMETLVGAETTPGAVRGREEGISN